MVRECDGPVSWSILWVVRDIGWHDGSLACRWAAEVMARAGISVTVQPLKPPVGPEIVWPAAIKVNSPVAQSRWGRSQRRRLSDLATSFDRVLCDMDFETEFHLLESLNANSRTCLITCQPDIPEQASPSWYERVDRIVALSRTAYRAVAHAGLVLESRLWLVPPLVDWGIHQSIDWPFDRERPVVCVAGVIGPTKGLEVVSNALTVLNDRGRRWGLLVLGDGTDRLRLEAYAQALGVDAAFVPNVEHWGAWIRRAQILVAPQFRDGMAFEVDAARLVGTPVAGTGLSAIEERIDSTGVDHLMDQSTVMGLVDLLENMSHPDRMPQIPSAGDRLESWLEALDING